MKTKIRMIGLGLILLALFLSGCASSMTSQEEMFIAPNFEQEEARSETLTNVMFRLPPRLDVADSAFLYDLGIKTPSLSWKAILWRKQEGDWQKEELKALRLRRRNAAARLIITIPYPLDEVKDDYLAVVDHAGNRIYNRQGKYIMKDYRDVDPEKLSEFLSLVGNSDPLELKKGSQDYKQILSLYKKFAVLEALQFRDYIYKKEGIPAGTVLTQEQLDRIDEKYESHTSKLKELFLDDWYVIFTYPLLSPVEYGGYIMASKLFQIPSVWWKKDVNRPGYMDRKLTAAGAYDMMSYFAQHYLSRGGSLGSGELTAKEQQILQEATGKKFSTYGEYLQWVRKKNQEIEEYNQKLE